MPIRCRHCGIWNGKSKRHPGINASPQIAKGSSIQRHCEMDPHDAHAENVVRIGVMYVRSSGEIITIANSTTTDCWRIWCKGNSGKSVGIAVNMWRKQEDAIIWGVGVDGMFATSVGAPTKHHQSATHICHRCMGGTTRGINGNSVTRSLVHRRMLDSCGHFHFDFIHQKEWGVFELNSTYISITLPISCLPSLPVVVVVVVVSLIPTKSISDSISHCFTFIFAD